MLVTMCDIMQAFCPTALCKVMDPNRNLTKTALCSGPALRVHIFNLWTIIMQSLNIKEWNLFELQIIQCKHSTNVV